MNLLSRLKIRTKLASMVALSALTVCAIIAPGASDQWDVTDLVAKPELQEAIGDSPRLEYGSLTEPALAAVPQNRARPSAPARSLWKKSTWSNSISIMKQRHVYRKTLQATSRAASQRSQTMGPSLPFEFTECSDDVA